MLTPRKRPSPAMVVAMAGALMALAALIVSMAGTATGLPGKSKVDGNDLRQNVVGFKNMQDNAIGGVEVRANALGGADVNESSLAKVPSAANADSADAVDGISAFEVDLSTNDNGALQQLDLGAFKVSLSCGGGEVSLHADSDVSLVLSTANAAASQINEIGGDAFDFSDNFKTTGDPHVSLDGGQQHGVGTLVAQTSSSALPGGATNYTLNYRYQDASGCSVNGNALIS